MKFVPHSVFLMVVSVYLLAGIELVPLHGDEPTQIDMGQDYVIQFVQGDVQQLLYTNTPSAEQDLRLLNGTLPKYVFGWITYSMGYIPETWVNQYDWGADFTYNQQNNHIPTPDNLYRTRLSSVLFLVLGAWGIYVLGLYLGGTWVAVVAVLYYALNPALLINGKRAMMEGYLTGFSILVVLCAVWLLQHSQGKLWRYVLLGAISSLALISKHTAVFTIASVWFAVVFIEGYRLFKRENTWRVLRYGLLGVLVLVGVFLLMNPAWWNNPIERVSTVLQLRTSLLNGQIQAFGGYPNFGEQLAGFWRQVFMVQPMYYEVNTWADPLREAIVQYESSPFRGVVLGDTIFGGVLMLILVVIGTVRLLQPNIWDKPILWVLLCWGLGMLILTLLLTPLEWQRYYLPIYPVIGLLSAQGLVSVLLYVWRLSKASFVNS
jgi:4-amino-4-deoxy-L-arabinose transferase-like glycosyltransferase